MSGPAVIETVRLRVGDGDELRYYRQVWYPAMTTRKRGGADEVVTALLEILSRTRGGLARMAALGPLVNLGGAS